ncbi:MAG TPA: amidohydrolase family protein, partial [Planctomycetota bacterium]|nr:amidohydrolase family protein [Planctomycetota bacterium]
FIYCATPSDVFRAFEVIDANQLKATLVLPRDAYKLAGVLKARKDLGPVVLDDDLVTWETDPETGAEERHVTPRILYDAGIRFALQAAEDGRDRGPAFSREGETHLWYQAALLVRHGVPRVEALKSITTTPARILGLEHRLGTIESGKDGTVTVFSGDPLDARSWVEQVFIEGRLVYRKDQDRDLEMLLKDPEAKF